MITVLSNQSIIDIAIQESGSALLAFEWAMVNNISITDLLVPGQKLIAPNFKTKDNDIAVYFKSRNQNIATANQPETIINNYQFPYGLPLTL